MNQRSNGLSAGNLRVMVKQILRKYGYPPAKQEKATRTALEQAELIAADWAEWGHCE